MKMQAAHYEHLFAAIKPNANKIAAHRQFIVHEGKAKDVDKRLRWDLMYYAQLSPWVCATLYPYLDDGHIDTALRQVIRDLEPIQV